MPDSKDLIARAAKAARWRQAFTVYSVLRKKRPLQRFTETTFSTTWWVR